MTWINYLSPTKNSLTIKISLWQLCKCECCCMQWKPQRIFPCILLIFPKAMTKIKNTTAAKPKKRCRMKTQLNWLQFSTLQLFKKLTKKKCKCIIRTIRCVCVCVWIHGVAQWPKKNTKLEPNYKRVIFLWYTFRRGWLTFNAVIIFFVKYIYLLTEEKKKRSACMQLVGRLV